MNGVSTLGRLSITRGVIIGVMLYLATHGRFPLMAPSGPSVSSDGEQVTGIVLQVIFLCVLGVLALPNAARVVTALKRAWPVTALCMMALASTSWSQDPSLTFRRAVMLLAPTILAAVLHVRYSYQSQVQLFFYAGLAAALVSIVVAILFPSYGLDRTFVNQPWEGIFPQKNVCARACVFFMLPAVVMIGRSAKKTMLSVSTLTALGTVVFMTGSRTGAVCAFAVLVVGLTLRIVPKLSRGAAFIMSSAGVICVAISIYLLSSDLQHLLFVLGNDGTLTGRTKIWQGAIHAIGKRPLLGYGYSAFWIGLKGEAVQTILETKWLVPAAHNGWLDLLLQLGVVGVMLFLFSLLRALSTAGAALRYARGEAAEWCAGILLLTILYNIDESSLMIPIELLWVMYVLAFMNLVEIERSRRHEIAARARIAEPRMAVGRGIPATV
jgi:exopolysaccharide production protein ExoQ